MQSLWSMLAGVAIAVGMSGQYAVAMTGAQYAQPLSTTAGQESVLPEGRLWSPTTAETVPIIVAQALRERGQQLRERLQGMPPDRREVVQQDVSEWKEAFAGLSGEEQEALASAFKRSVERLRGLSPDQRQQLKEATARMSDTLKEVKQHLTPEQEERLEQTLKQISHAYAELTVVQKTRILSRIAGAVDTMGSLSPEQKERIEAALESLIGS